MEWQSECYPATAAAPGCHGNWGRKSDLSLCHNQQQIAVSDLTDPLCLSLLAFFFCLPLSLCSDFHWMILSLLDMKFALRCVFLFFPAPLKHLSHILAVCVYMCANMCTSSYKKPFISNLPLSLQNFVSTSSWESNSAARTVYVEHQWWLHVL